MHKSSIRKNALHDITLIKLTVTRFVDTGGLFARYSNDNKKVAFTEMYPRIL
jgi:hypothetical protein